MKIRNVIAALGVASVAATLVTPAFAGNPNGAWTWQENGGARIFGKVQIQGSYPDPAGHAKQGYHRFTREAGPSLDTGRWYTSEATSKSDTTYRNRTDYVWDSPLWGDRYVTHYHYGIIRF